MTSIDGSEHRLAGAAGIASAVLLLIAAIMIGGEPFPDASAGKILSWYQQHRLTVQTAGALHGLGAIPFLLFVAHLRHRLTLAHGRAGFLSACLFGGALASVTVDTVSSLPAVGLTLAASRPGSVPPPSLVHLLADFNFFQHGNLGLLSVVFVGSLGLLALRGNLAARWVGWIGMVASVLAIVGGTSSFFPNVAGKPNPLGLVGFVGFILTELTVIITGVLLMTRRESGPSAVESTGTR